MVDMPEEQRSGIDNLEAENARLREEIAELRAEVDRLRNQVSTATLNEHGETFNVSTAGTNAMATLCVASRSCQGRKSSM